MDIASIACAGFMPNIDKQTSSAIQVSITCTTAPNAGMFSLGTEGNMVLTGGHGKGGTPQHFFWQAKATPSTLRILYTGEYNGKEVTNQDVTNKKVHVHAGWPIKLTAQLTPANAKATYTWTIQGAGGNGSAAINGYVSNTTTGAPVVIGNASETAQAHVVALIPSNDTISTFPDPASPGILKSYYYTESGSFTASVQPQGSGIPAAKTTFSVEKPSPKFAANYAGNTQFTQAKGIATLHLYSSRFGTGIVFQHQPVHSTEYKGSSFFAQVYAENDLWVPANGGKPPKAVGSGLDKSLPYPNAGTLADGQVYTDDSPANTTYPNYVFMSAVDTPRMWLMYKPLTANSIYVPLDSARWPWGGATTYNAKTNSWILNNRYPFFKKLPATVHGSGLTNAFPEWTTVLLPPNPPH